ncbi:ArsR/SmtB family transcription factor [Streptomyces griseus]|uniref:ArsR/SmtB family transcription factor n=1 Tax=Streptomyces griseus TaxID=1911 RepID=UPI00083FEF3A|nr:winged helix-turn-helix domain-containing protein [Streptomyces griseus]
MELEERVAELERRIAALESAGDRGAPELGDGDFWALDGLKDQLDRVGDAAADGGVLFTGAVRLPAGERYEWQYGALTAGLLGADEDRPDWSEAAEPLAALGHPVRLRLLREILGGRRTAAELAGLDETGTTGQIYHHLRLLTAAGWLQTAGRGRYEVPGARVVPLLVVLTAARP